MTWLKHADQEENHRAACNVRSANTKTGRWFIEGEKFDEFKAKHRSLLWLHGNPGCGKTVLSSAAIENILSISRADGSILAAYWYFNSNDKRKESLEDCAKGIISQFLARMDRIPPTIEKLYMSKASSRGTAPRPPELPELITALQSLIAQEHRQFFILLDALDEAAEAHQEDLLHLLRDLLATDNEKVHILVTSRPFVKETYQNEVHDEKALYFDIAIERENVDVDIKLHLDEELATDPKLCKWPKKTQEKIKSSLIEKADGM